jgi:glycosyltransferase involved in cell wall biosynthesis
MNSAPISVISANFNNGKYLPQFFESFKNSSIHPKELIFVDDGSKDNSLEIAAHYANALPFLKIIPLPENQGFANALNAGLDQATGQYILRIDPDDHISENFIKIQHELISRLDVDVLGCNLAIFRSQDNTYIGTSNTPVSHAKIAKAILAGEHGVVHGTTLTKRWLFDKHRYVQANVPAEDYDIFARFLQSGAKFENNPAALVNYRVHSESITSILPLSTVEKTYTLRDQIFGTRTSRFHVLKYYYHLKLYREALSEPNILKKVFFLIISSALYPTRAFRKIWQQIKDRST